MKAEAGCFRSFKGRLCCVVMVAGVRRYFYRSTGRNSGQPGTWFPFGGILPWAMWFIKAGADDPALDDRDHPLHRFGTEANKAISEQLDGLEPDGDVVALAVDQDGALELNDWLATTTDAIELGALVAQE